MSSVNQKSPPSSPPNRPSQVSKPSFDSLNANIAKNRITPSSATTLLQQKPRTVPIPEPPFNLVYPPKITANASDKPKRSSREKKSSSSRKKGSPLDSIDKLDVTGMYGQGSFHHDGPFDACRPHRNKRISRAPVAAFPANGPNNTLDGVDYRRSNQNTENRIMGRADNEAFEEFSLGVQQKKQQEDEQHLPLIRDNSSGGFDPTVKSNPVHGDTTLGLGTSTFLEGAPAPKSLKVDQAGDAQEQIKRKKSIVQRLRGNSHSNEGSAEKAQAKKTAVTANPLLTIKPTPVSLSSESDCTTLGLGTSKFLEDAPKTVNVSQAGEAQQHIKRKKSIVQRLRGNTYSSGSSSSSLSTEKAREKEAADTADPLPTIQPTPAHLSSESDGDSPQPPPPSSSTGGNSFLRRVKSLKMVTNRGRRTVTEPIM